MFFMNNTRSIFIKQNFSKLALLLTLIPVGHGRPSTTCKKGGPNVCLLPHVLIRDATVKFVDSVLDGIGYFKKVQI